MIGLVHGAIEMWLVVLPAVDSSSWTVDSSWSDDQVDEFDGGGLAASMVMQASA